MSNAFILLVEDNPDDELLALRALEINCRADEVVVAHDGVEALDFLLGEGSFADRDVSKQPALILLDLKLPKIDGLQVLKKIRANPHTENIPVVVLTSSNEEQDISASYRNHANSYIRKPVDFDNFVEAVGQLGMYWLELNQTASQKLSPGRG